MIDKLVTEISIDLYGETKEYLVSAKQNDKNTRQIHVTLLSNGVPYEIPKDSILIVNVKKPDGKYVYNQCHLKNNVVVVDMTNQMLAASGTATADINIKTNDNEQILSSASFTIEIEPSMYDDSAIMSSNEMNMLDTWIQEVKSQEEIRVKAEKERIEAETFRKENEETRIESENQRNENEKERIKCAEKLQADSETAIKNTEAATEAAKQIVERGESALSSQEKLEETLSEISEMQQNMSSDNEAYLSEMKKLADQIRNHYNLLFVSADGGTPMSIDLITIDGGTPMSTDSLVIDCGTPYSL